MNDHEFNALVLTYRKIKQVLINHFGATCFKGLRSLEVGCGRGTISSLLKVDGFYTCGFDSTYGSERNFDELWKADAIDIMSYHDEFDLVISYGLLEHFKNKDQIKILDNCAFHLNDSGIQIHYIVPRKLVNIFESRDIYRSSCNMIMSQFYGEWVYPVTYGTRFYNGVWKTNFLLGKGAILANPRVDYSPKWVEKG